MILPESPTRHDLIWLTPAGAAAATVDLAAAERGLVLDWLNSGRPLIHTRRRAGDPAGWLPLGLPLPPSLGKRRLALCVPPDGLERCSAPPLLATVIDCAPPAWREWLIRLEQGARNLQLCLRVFGSLAWQYLTGDTYLSESSDLDLLWSPVDQAQLQAGLALLQEWERKSGLRADGEVLLPVGAVAWRELASAPSHVLVKDAWAVTLRPLSTIHNTLLMQVAQA
jgi:phosphoribosyl-dephospho-CoA transferase